MLACPGWGPGGRPEDGAPRNRLPHEESHPRAGYAIPIPILVTRTYSHTHTPSIRSAAKPSSEDVLYRRGKHSNTCTLILNGKVGESYLCIMLPLRVFRMSKVVINACMYVCMFVYLVGEHSWRARRA